MSKIAEIKSLKEQKQLINEPLKLDIERSFY